MFHSLIVAVICTVLHANDLATRWSADDTGIKTVLLLPIDNDQRMSAYIRGTLVFVRRILSAFYIVNDVEGGARTELYGFLESETFGIWVSIVSLLVVHHVMERTAHVRALFYAENRHVVVADSVDRTRSFSASSVSTTLPSERPSDMMEMADWFSYSVAQTGMQMFVGISIIASRFDVRQLLAMTTNNGEETKKDLDPFFFDFSDEDDGCNDSDDDDGDAKDFFTFDFMADCGDGFHSSYAIAYMLAQPRLRVQSHSTNSVTVLRRGRLLLVGGDLAYPTPSHENYTKRFVRVFEDALPWKGNGDPDRSAELFAFDKQKLREEKRRRPTMFAVPGNHDHFDGLAVFIRHICQRPYIGNWALPQTKSYVCLALPCQWFIFGLDNGLVGDIDATQFRYFASLADRLPPNANVIVVTHDPSWILDVYDRRQEREEEPRYLDLLLNRPSVRSKLRLRLSGDIHNYTRHEPKRSGENTGNKSTNRNDAPTLIVSGGGGAYVFSRIYSIVIRSPRAEADAHTRSIIFFARHDARFLHPTHVGPLGKDDFVYNEQTYEEKCAFPSVETSYNLSFENIWKFRKRNILFDLTGGMLYLFLAFPLFSACNMTTVDTIVQTPESSWVCAGRSDSCYFWRAMFGFEIESMVGLLRITCSVVANEILVHNVKAVFTCWLIMIALCDASHMLKKLTIGTIHAGVHVFCASFCAVFLQWILETLNRMPDDHERMRWNESVVLDGQFTTEWSERFPDLAAAFDTFGSYTFGFAPALLKWTTIVLNSPRSIVVLQSKLCNEAETDEYVHHNLYLLFRSLWFWVLACPLCAIVFGSYLAISVGFLSIHWNEGFSSLQSFNYKNFTRLRIDRRSGDLEIFAIGLSKSPTQWKSSSHPSCVSRWVPDVKKTRENTPRIVDYVRIPRVKKGTSVK